MTRAIRIHETGGPERLRWEEIEVGSPGPGEVLLRQTAVGLNFIDVYHRTGLYPVPGLPAVLGMEGAGVVLDTGKGVTEVSPGDRVAYAGVPMGAYAEVRLMPAHRLVTLPGEIDDVHGAAMMLKGMTARYLLRRCYPLQSGETILVHAAAGGVGLILCQWANHLGAEVIGTVGSEKKAELARERGCHHPILYREENFVDRVRDITGGAGVSVVYDSVGRDTFHGSLDCLRPMGMMVSFGQSSGSIPPIETGLLSAKGSLFLTRPSLLAYTEERNDLLETAADLFDVVKKGIVKIEVNQTYPLSETAMAHIDLEERKTTGSTVLIP